MKPRLFYVTKCVTTSHLIQPIECTNLVATVRYSSEYRNTMIVECAGQESDDYTSHVEITRCAETGDRVRVSTWVRGDDGKMMPQNYEIHS